MAGLILGVDGGGTKTAAVVADLEGNELGRGSAGASNFQAVGLELAREALLQAVHGCFSAANLPAQTARYMCLGMAGAGRVADQEQLREWCLQKALAEQVEVISDAELLLWAGTPQGWGLGCISGTGSMAFGADRSGRKARSGGWGYILGDEGSGYAIGLEALRAVTRAADGRGPATTLTHRVLHAWGLGQADDLVRRVYQRGAGREEISALVQLAAEEARAGDAAAVQILENAARDLSKALEACARQLNLKGAVPCALGGGVLSHNAELCAQVVQFAHRAGVCLEPVTIVRDPVMGAIRKAVKMVKAV